MDSQYGLFIDELIKKRNLSDMSPEAYEEIKKDAMERLDYFLLDRLIDKFSDDDAEQFVSLLTEKKSAQDAEKFATEHIDDYGTFMTNTLNDFSTNYFGNSS